MFFQKILIEINDCIILQWTYGIHLSNLGVVNEFTKLLKPYLTS